LNEVQGAETLQRLQQVQTFDFLQGISPVTSKKPQCRAWAKLVHRSMLQGRWSCQIHRISVKAATIRRRRSGVLQAKLKRTNSEVRKFGLHREAFPGLERMICVNLLHRTIGKPTCLERAAAPFRGPSRPCPALHSCQMTLNQIAA
jgi:hypothetical protein